MGAAHSAWLKATTWWSAFARRNTIWCSDQSLTRSPRTRVYQAVRASMSVVLSTMCATLRGTGTSRGRSATACTFALISRTRFSGSRKRKPYPAPGRSMGPGRSSTVAPSASAQTAAASTSAGVGTAKAMWSRALVRAACSSSTWCSGPEARR
ncbi:hypothetical protein BJF79_04585 [Actinomadura sp. CNU-125]|nr:hypothetical protein BJF79_04585 [Actinomadura sp. CNU-125]